MYQAASTAVHDAFSSVQSDPFRELESEHLQMKYFCDSMGLVKPEEIVLHRDIARRPMGSCSRLAVSKQSMFYIPLLNSLSELLNNKYIYEEVQNTHHRTDGYISDYCDAMLYKQSNFFQNHPKALQIILYYDDVEVCNPLGSKSKVHKLGLFYYTLGNIMPIHRSSLRSIQLVSVLKVDYLQKVGINAVLQPFMDELKYLEQDEGVTIKINGIEETFHGTLIIGSADNLSSQLLGGYKSLASALRKCRFCMAVKSDMETKFDDSEFQFRTRETHAIHIQKLRGPLQEHIATTYGIEYESVLNCSRYFHVTEGLVMDIMHDILEGTLMYETKELLKYLTSSGKCTLDHINHKITSFPYGYSEVANKPAVIKADHLSANDHKLRQNASQMWCLGRLLPLMLGEVVPIDDQHWECFLQLMTIVDYVFAPVTSNDIATFIKELITDNHKIFKEVYPSCSITPKMHYMIHIPYWIIKCGPLSRMWCMRFEAKHSYFKTLAHRVRNFKNIPKTLAIRHQQLMCYYLQNTHSSPLGKSIKTGKGVTMSVAECEYHNILTQLDTVITDETTMQCVKWIQIAGTTYRPNGVLVIKSELMPAFGVIIQIVKVENTCIFVCKEFTTLCFSNHFHAFEIKESSKTIAIKYDDLPDYHVLSTYKLHTHTNVSFVSMKYHIIENI